MWLYRTRIPTLINILTHRMIDKGRMKKHVNIKVIKTKRRKTKIRKPNNAPNFLVRAGPVRSRHTLLTVKRREKKIEHTHKRHEI